MRDQPRVRPARRRARGALVWWHRQYGASPVQLLVISAAFAVAALVMQRLVGNPSLGRILLWFMGAVIGHDLIAFPLYAAVDRGLRYAGKTHRRARQLRVPAVNHLRLPAAASSLLLLVYLPGIIRQGSTTYHTATGQTQQPFLGRWILITAGLFGLSALTYSVRLLAARSHDRHSRR